MDWGLHFPSHIRSFQWVSYGEQKGFSYYMPYDSIGSDVYQTLALCAINTKTIKLGPGVTSPKSRIAPDTARAMATLNELAQGRCIMGIGTGNTARRAWGMPPAKVDELRDYVGVCRKMFKGEEALHVEGPDRYMNEEKHRYVKFLSPDWGFINIKDPIPIYLAGSGPRMLELAGEIGDGVILLGAIGESFVNYCMEHIGIGAQRAGRDASSLYKIVLTAFHILQDGETLESKSVKQSVGPVVAVCLNIAALSLANYERKMGGAKGEPLPGDIRHGVMRPLVGFTLTGVITNGADMFGDIAGEQVESTSHEIGGPAEWLVVLLRALPARSPICSNQEASLDQKFRERLARTQSAMLHAQDKEVCHDVR